MEQAEEWRPVVGYEGVYRISSLGNVFSEPRWRAHGGLLKPLIGRKDEYPFVTLYAKYLGKAFNKSVSIHILVAESFLGARPDGMQVNHKDGVKGNAALSNLEYVTPQENIDHAKYVLNVIRSGPGSRGSYETVARGERAGKAKLTESQVLDIRARYIPYKVHQGILSKEFGVSPTTINCIIRRQYWTHI